MMSETVADPLVSIIVPVYNTRDFVAACIDSLLAQTYGNVEIVAVDDGSTDGSAQVLSHYVQRTMVRVLSRSNGGLSAARNTGLGAAKGEYVMFVDSDDTLHPEAVERLVRIIQKHEADFVRFGLHKIIVGVPVADRGFDDGCTIEVLRNPLEDYLARQFLPSVCVCMYRRAAVGDIRFEEGLIFEDLDFTWRFLRRADSGVYVKWAAYRYTQTADSITRSPATPRKFAAIATILRRLTDHYRENADNRIAKLQRRLFPYVVKSVLLKPSRSDADLRRQADFFAGGLLVDGIIREIDFSPRWWPRLVMSRLRFLRGGAYGRSLP